MTIMIYHIIFIFICHDDYCYHYDGDEDAALVAGRRPVTAWKSWRRHKMGLGTCLSFKDRWPWVKTVVPKC